MPGTCPFSCRDVLAGWMLLALACASVCPASETSDLLTDEERKSADTCIAQFDADEFQTREDAQVRLMAFGPRVQPLLARRLGEFLQRGTESAEIAARLQASIRGIERVEIEKILENLETAIDQSPACYLPPDPLVKERLSRQTINFEWTDAPLRDVLAVLARRTETQIVFDPNLENDSAAEIAISLHVKDMTAEQAMNWVMRMSDLTWVIRAKAVIVTSNVRAGKLNLQLRHVDLPLAPGDSAWTQEETEALAELCKEWPVLHADTADDIYTPATPELAQAERPGRIRLHAAAGHFEALETFLKSVGKEPPAPPSDPIWVDALEKKLDEKFSCDAQNTPLADVLDMAGKRLEASLQLSPRSEAGVSVSFDLKNVAGRDFVLELCRRAEFSALPSKGALCFCRRDQLCLSAAPRIIDARPALKAGVEAAALKAKLDALLGEVHQSAASHLVHGRWLAIADPWTAQRAAKLIEQAVQQKRLPEAAPDAPWFFATFK
jgi:hypothetical protein